MKKLGIDARLYFQTGVGTYLRNLLHFLQKESFTGTEITVIALDTERNIIEKELTSFRVVSVPYKWHSIQEQIGYLQFLNQEHFDLTHFTYFSYPYLYNGKFISTIHDLTPLLFKTGKASTRSLLAYELKYRGFKLLLSNQVSKSVSIITPTKTIKNQIVEIYGDKYSQKIKPIYEGIDESLLSSKPDSSVLKKYKLKDYFLYVGNFYPHKNVETLINAFKKVPGDQMLVLVGPDDFFANRVQELITNSHLQKNVLILHGMNKEQLKALYQNAKALVHPSLSEGFGLPVIEAVFFDVPVIGSDIPVFKELLGNNYTSFNPRDEQSITDTIASFKPSKCSYNEIKEKFSFEKMAKQHASLYRKALDI